MVGTGQVRWNVFALAAAAALAAIACGGGNGNTGAPGTGGVPTSGTGGVPTSGTGGTPTSQSPGMGGGGGTGVGGAAGSACVAPQNSPGVWAEVTAPPEAAGFQASDAFALGTGDLIFAGTVSGPNGIELRLLRWSHGCWTVELSGVVIGSSTTTPALKASVHGTGPEDLWAVGGDQIYHRDAQGWSPFDSTWRAKVTMRVQRPLSLTRVRAAGANDVWITEASNILRWTSAGWTVYNFDDPGFPNISAAIAYSYEDIWIDAANSVVVSGGSAQVGSTQPDGFIHHFDGSTWTHSAVALYNVYSLWRSGPSFWVAAPGQVFEIVGELTLGQTDGTTRATFVVIQGGSLSTPPHMVTLWGRGNGELWASGNDVAHFDGTTWRLDASAPPSARNWPELRNTFVTGDPSAVWLVTPGAHFFHNAFAATP